jgi:HEAT repeat protein
LTENLQADDQVVRMHAATVLGTMADDAAEAVPFLIDLLASDDIQDRRLAALTLGEIGPVAEEAIEPLLAAVEDEDDGVAESAVRPWN